MSKRVKASLITLLTLALVTGYFLAWLMYNYPHYFGLLQVEQWNPTRKALVEVGFPIPTVIWIYAVVRVVREQ